MPQPRTTGWTLHPPGPLRRQRLPEAHTLLGIRRTGQGARVRARDGHRVVGLFARRRGYMFVRRRRGFEAVLGRGWRCVLHPYGRSLESEGFGLGEGEVFGCELGVFVVVMGGRLTVFGGRVRVLVWVGRAEREAGCVGCGLGAELGEVEVGTGFVAEVHGFVEAAFGVEAIEDDAVDGDGDYLNDDFDEGADERPILRADVNWSLYVKKGKGEDVPEVCRQERSLLLYRRDPSAFRPYMTSPTCLCLDCAFYFRSRSQRRLPT